LLESFDGISMDAPSRSAGAGIVADVECFEFAATDEFEDGVRFALPLCRQLRWS
jgi:hypothetical protein